MEDHVENQRLSALIERAIKNEEEAYEFYMSLYRLVEDPVAKETLQFLAGEEKKHREFLMAYRDGLKPFNALRMDEVIDYGIAQYVDAPDIQMNMNSIEVYLVAAHRELNSYNFYKNLAAIQPEGEAGEMLLQMAAQELKHKEKVEYLYSNSAFPQTAGG
jgi:rubrerythrin